MIEGMDTLPDSLILSSPAWHPGVVGICASRLTEEFSRPAILIAINEARGEGRGSARSIPGFDLYNAVKKCESLLKAYGGHKAAAGLTIAIENIDQFIEKFNDYTQQEFSTDDFTPEITIDAEIPLAEISCDVLEEIESLGPFGPSNPEPIFSSNEIKYYSSMIVGNGHLKLKIKEDGQFFEAIGFNMGSNEYQKGGNLRLAFVPQFNFFNGEKIIQLNLKDIKR